jgi:hypothetical protein
MAYVPAYELVNGREPLARRMRAMVPLALLGLVYIFVYKSLGYGVFGSAIYVDPTRSPLTFLKVAPGRALALSGGALLGFPADLWFMRPSTRPWLVAGGLLAIALITGLLRSLWRGLGEGERITAKALLLGGALALVPVLAAFPSTRLLLAPSLGIDGAVALMLAQVWAHRPRLRDWRTLGAGWFLLAHAISPVLVWPLSSLGLSQLAKQGEQMAEASELDDTRVGHQAVIVLVAPDATIANYMPSIRAVHGHPLPREWHVLSLAPYDHRFTRTGPSSLELEVLDGQMLTTTFEGLFRDQLHRLIAGDVTAVSGMRARVLEAGTEGPVRVAFDFDRPLDDPSLQIMVWEDGRLRRRAPPPVGQSYVWHRTPGALPF